MVIHIIVVRIMIICIFIIRIPIAVFLFFHFFFILIPVLLVHLEPCRFFLFTIKDNAVKFFHGHL